MHSFLTSHMFRGLLLMGLISLNSGLGSAWAIDRYADPAGAGTAPCDDPADPCPLIADALAAAIPSDRINLAAGTFTENGLVINQDLVIRGQGIGITVVDAGFADRHFTIAAGATEVKIKNLTLTNGNTTTDGGAIQVQSGLLKVDDSELSYNTALTTGGAISLVAGTDLSIRRSTLQENVSGTGGAIYSKDADVFIGNTELRDNEAGNGGAIFHQVVSTGSLEVLDSTFSGNSATINGGALYLWGAGEVKRSTFSSNDAANQGGAISISAGDLRMFNSTVSGNTAGVGGGLAVLGPVQAAVYSCTFVGNDSLVGNGGAISGASPSLDLTNTVITDSGNGDCGGGAGVVVGTSNLLDDVTCAPLGATNLGPVTNLDLVLQNNGGLTDTHALLAGSTAIDAGFGGCPHPNGLLLSHDQRGSGYIRSADGDADGIAVCDIGAFELQ